jgi:GH15 family glucan-1,4-alpha-glucosidase
MYSIRGEKKLEEKILKHLSGYQNSGPVRIGNSAYIQKQNDIYGILIDAIYISLNKASSNLDKLRRTRLCQVWIEMKPEPV